MALVSATPKDADKGREEGAEEPQGRRGQGPQRHDRARNKQLGVFTDEDSRVLDNEADRAWGALRQRLAAYPMIPEHAAADAKRAAEIDYALFQGSMEFLKLEYAVQSTRMSAILQQIDDQKLQHDLDKLVGAVFVRAIRASRAAALRGHGPGAPPPRQGDGARTSATRCARFQAAIVSYARPR